MGRYSQLLNNQGLITDPPENEIVVPNNLGFLTPQANMPVNPNANKLSPVTLNRPKQKKHLLGKALNDLNGNLGEIPEPSIFDVASAINVFRAANNYTQPKPPIVRLNKVDVKQNKLNEQPYQQMSDAIVGQNQGIMETIKRGSSTASSLLAAGNNIAANNVKGQNQVAMNYSNAAQQVMGQNIAQSNQANAANTEIGNQELLQNRQMLMQHAQMKKESIDNNINAAMAAQAQELQYKNQKEFADKTEKIQARNLEFQQKHRDYWMKRNDPNFQQKIHDERMKVMDNYNKEFGESSDNYKTEISKFEQELATKKIEDYGSYTDIARYKQEIKDAGTDQKKIDEINEKYKQDILRNRGQEYIRTGLSDYMSKNYKLEDILTRELGDTPTLDFSDILND